MIHHTQSAQILQKQDEHNIYVIMKTMCPPGYHHNGFMATHALEHMMFGYTFTYWYHWYLCSLLPAMCNRTSYAQVHELPQSHRGDNRESALFS